MTSAAVVIERTLRRLNPQMGGPDIVAVHIAQALDEAGLLWCEDELDVGRPVVTVDTAGLL